MKIISKTNGINFGVSSEFKSEYLAPIIQNLLFKAENEWDDYNEVYHCCKLIENVKSNENINMDFHIMKKDEKCLGVALVSSGILDYKTFFKEPIQINEEDKDILIFNYFHIAQEGRGNGEMWLKNIIQYYKSKHYKAIYLKSSHPKVFSMYNRLGIEVGEYSSYSDNNLFHRKGKIFKITL
ncbi:MULTISPECIES: hypothetical protein [Clostridium]|jgi:hypothetical protein|uniref:Uncharacterized protein n=2 Tax=Clostridium beijerinckii TaxID=1520 RepID=A0AAE2RU35_CLOBE|nr:MULTISPECIES: hypothetical protein [Clostridium]ABR35383.1 hypothetical protein Cbei_3254 [Clostridium beijerinckii NCIMB 8052]AIU05071.1 hypothetical protein Cbs_3254 [Clostridium beijerinckii ATCC 35702]MBF7809977.1 hypothetical protein [Clostridium beijerinckii]NOW90559.1 hypothetical protein [Clostridium beijerinckii]NRT23206.1 hypothetical protein [Clostridium beijerinckii]